MYNKMYLSISICITFLILTSCARPPKDIHSIEETMTLLTSDECNGRSPATPGSMVAIDYITKTYNKLGLDSYDEDYLQTYEQPVFDPATATQELTVVFNDQTKKTYAYGIDFLGGMLKHANIKAEITTDTFEVDEKIVVLDEVPRDFNVFQSNALGRFIKADVLFRSNFIRDEGKLIVKVTDNLYTDLTSGEVDYITYRDNVSTEDIAVDNIIGIIKGTDSSKALVLSAHFDHVGYAGETIFRGAVDNASGIAIMLEVAEQLTSYSKENLFDMDIIIAAFNGEESILLGSKAFVKDIQTTYDTIYNVNVDCIGKKDGGPIVTNGEWEDTGINDDLKKALIDSFAKHHVVLMDDHYGGSDHCSFNDMNYPGITLGQRDVLGEDDTTSIHTVEDTLDIIDYTVLDDVVNAIYQFVIEHNGAAF